MLRFLLVFALVVCWRLPVESSILVARVHRRRFACSLHSLITPALSMALAAKAKMSHEEKGRKQLQAGAARVNHGMKVQCKRVLDSCDWVVAGVKQYMQSVGAMGASGNPILSESDTLKNLQEIS